MKKLIAVVLVLAIALSLVGWSSKDETTIKVGATPAPHAAILEVVKPLMTEKGFNLEIVEFEDYVIPNTALEEGELDANYFQHVLYMNGFNEEQGTHLVNAAGIHYEPFGLYAGKTASLEDLPEGAQIGVPNDGTNEARALLLLEQVDLIKLTEGIGLDATKSDIAENPKNIEVVELEARLLTTTLQDVDMAVINGNYAIDAGLSVKEAIAVEAADGTAAEYYQNVIAVKEGNEAAPAVLALIECLKTDTVRDFINETYDGAVVPLF